MIFSENNFKTKKWAIYFDIRLESILKRFRGDEIGYFFVTLQRNAESSPLIISFRNVQFR